MKKSYLIAACLAVALPTLSISTEADAAGKAERGLRGQLVHRIVMKWGNHVQEAYRADVREWASDMVPLFSKASIDTLKRAASSPTFELMNDAFLVDDQGNTVHTNLLNATNAGALGGPIKSRLLGETTNDLVFVPITPCRIIDTRLAGGQIAAGTTRSFDVTAVSDYSFQGGDASNCGGAGAAGSFAAAAINFTVVFPVGGPGHITAYPFLASLPTAASLNFSSGDVRGNFGIFRLDQGASANELSVFTTHTTHLVGDLVGYFINPELGNLDCQETFSSNITVNANSTGTGSSPACAAGYTIISGGCTMSTFDGRVVSSRSFPNSNTHFCAFRNENATSSNLGVVYGRCCKLPSGRAP
jgi:hypothetical protein